MGKKVPGGLAAAARGRFAARCYGGLRRAGRGVRSGARRGRGLVQLRSPSAGTRCPTSWDPAPERLPHPALPPAPSPPNLLFQPIFLAGKQEQGTKTIAKLPSSPPPLPYLLPSLLHPSLPTKEKIQRLGISPFPLTPLNKSLALLTSHNPRPPTPPPRPQRLPRGVDANPSLSLLTEAFKNNNNKNPQWSAEGGERERSPQVESTRYNLGKGMEHDGEGLNPPRRTLQCLSSPRAPLSILSPTPHRTARLGYATPQPPLCSNNQTVSEERGRGFICLFLLSLLALFLMYYFEGKVE